MQLKFEKENYGKLVLIGTTLLMWLLILILFKTYGYDKTWHLWKVPTQKLPFMDFRLIPGSAESFRHGYEPSIENPDDPNGRIFNYPAFWRLFFYTEISQADTIWISVLMIVLFFISAFLFSGRLSIQSAIWMLLVLFSPASMLLYERGNVDLIVFFVCAMIVLAATSSTYVATMLIAFGSIVKLFPFFGVSVLLKESKKKFWILFGICLLILVTYMVATWSSVKASWNFTMRGDDLSYGTNVFVTRYGNAISQYFAQWLVPAQIDLFLKYGSLVIALILLLAIVLFAFPNTQQPEISNEQNFAAFRMGASIYVGTFLLGNNWDYRLAFLVLVVPQLVGWLRSANKIYRVIAWLSVVLVLLSCWHLWIIQIPLGSIFHSVANSQKFWFILDEIFNWTLFLSLAYLLLASIPDWLKTPIRNLLPIRI